MKVVVTGASGLLGWHCAARLHAANCAARFRGDREPYALVTLDRDGFSDPQALADAVTDADAVFHFAGVNRGADSEVEAANPEIAEALLTACQNAVATPHIVYANSTHSRRGSTYGLSKRRAGEILSKHAGKYTDLILPHIFGECARPYYNNVTATLIDQIWHDVEPTINPAGRVQLLHAGQAVQVAIDAVANSTSGAVAPAGRDIAVSDLYARLSEYHREYTSNIFPALDSAFELALFNSYRTGGYPGFFPLRMKMNTDARGDLFETAKSRGSSQSFVSSTRPGQRRGDHFHLELVERFMVVSGDATIRVRKVLTQEVETFRVSGADPVAIDMPPLHTHHIENTSERDAITFFWSHRHFDPVRPDTYADLVLEAAT